MNIFFILLTGLLGSLITALTSFQLADGQSFYEPYKTVFIFFITHRVIIIFICVVINFFAYLGSAFLSALKKDVLLKRVLSSMFSDIFESDFSKHRVSLFKEVSYLETILHCLYRKNPSRIFSLKFMARYLIVNHRLGGFDGSSTMFRVEKDDRKKTEGIVGLIRLTKTTALITNLPDLSNFDFQHKNKIKDFSRSKQKIVADYMERGSIREFGLLKKINRRANHLYGTIIETKGSPWGVLLADTIGNPNPFDNNKIMRFNAYAKIFSSIIEVE